MEHNHMKVFDLLHILGGNDEAFSRNAREFSACITCKPKNESPFFQSGFGGADDIRRVAASADCDDQIFRLHPTLDLWLENICKLSIIRPGENERGVIREAKSLHRLATVELQTLLKVVDNVGGGGAASAIPHQNNSPIFLPRFLKLVRKRLNQLTLQLIQQLLHSG